jgi:hypothetical protein
VTSRTRRLAAPPSFADLHADKINDAAIIDLFHCIVIISLFSSTQGIRSNFIPSSGVECPHEQIADNFAMIFFLLI